MTLAEFIEKLNELADMYGDHIEVQATEPHGWYAHEPELSVTLINGRNILDVSGRSK